MEKAGARKLIGSLFERKSKRIVSVQTIEVIQMTMICHTKSPLMRCVHMENSTQCSEYTTGDIGYLLDTEIQKHCLHRANENKRISVF